ncbi:MAG: hypothetical protein AAF548_04795 [Actinomycetota bacterium]
MADENPAPPKRKRRPRAELKELMIEGGVEVLAADGIEMQISSVSYAKVFDHLEKTRGVRVTYGSVHERIWDSLQEYQLSVIERAGLWDSSSSDQLPSAYVMEGVAELEGKTGDDRTVAFREVFRRFALDYIPSTETEDAWSQWLKTIVSMSTQPEGSVVRDAARTGAVASYESLMEMGRPAVEGAISLGFEAGDTVAALDDPIDVLVRTSIALAEGLDLRTALTEEPEPKLMLATGPGGELQEWNYYGFAMWGVINAYFDRVDP